MTIAVKKMNLSCHLVRFWQSIVPYAAGSESQQQRHRGPEVGETERRHEVSRSVMAGRPTEREERYLRIGLHRMTVT